jgi:hypothetical protein
MYERADQRLSPNNFCSCKPLFITQQNVIYLAKDPNKPWVRLVVRIYDLSHVYSEQILLSTPSKSSYSVLRMNPAS